MLTVLLGLLIVEMIATSSYSIATGLQSSPSTKLPPLEPPKELSKVFTGKNAVSQAKAFLARKHLTLIIKFDSMKNVTFVGIALRPVGDDAYIPAYYIVEGAKPSQYQLLRKKFETFAEAHFKAEVSNVRVNSAIEPNVNWNYAGLVDWITSTTSFLNQKGVLELKGFYYYYIVDSNTIEYYAVTKVRGDVSSSWVSLKDLRLHVSREETYEAIDDFLPDGHIGPTTSYSESILIGLSSDKTAQISASASYTVNTNDKYYFRMDTHTLNPNEYVDFHAYDFKKNVRFAPDHPAWGKSFYFKTAVTMHVNSPDNACYFGVFKYDASAEFYFQVPVGLVPVITKSPNDIKISVYVYPPHTVFHS
ncbi:hypothetical protein [Thermococcus prieurii]